MAVATRITRLWREWDGRSGDLTEPRSTGTPQIILSPWYDCHDFGMRVEW